MTRVAWFTWIVFLTITVVALLWRFHVEVLLFLLSIAIAAAVRPVPAYWAERGLRPIVALLLTYIIGISGLAALVYLLGNEFLYDLQQVSNGLASAYQTITQQWPSGTDLQRAIAAQLPPPAQLYSALSGAQGQEAARAALAFSATFLNVATNLAIALVLSLYWGADYARLERLWLSLLPAEQRAPAHSIWAAIEAGVGAYIRSEFIQALAALVLLDVGYGVLGLHYPALLAVIGGLAWLIPLAGAILALVPVVLVALTQGTVLAITAGIFTLAVLAFLEFVVQPRFVRLPHASSVLIVIFIVAMSNALGLFGLIAAPPLAVATQILLQRLLPVPSLRKEPAVSVAELKERIVAERATIAGMPLTSPGMKSLRDRLDRLVNDVHQATSPGGGDGEEISARQG